MNCQKCTKWKKWNLNLGLWKDSVQWQWNFDKNAWLRHASHTSPLHNFMKNPHFATAEWILSSIVMEFKHCWLSYSIFMKIFSVFLRLFWLASNSKLLSFERTENFLSQNHRIKRIKVDKWKCNLSFLWNDYVTFPVSIMP